MTPKANRKLATARARKLRKSETNAEALLWMELRGRRQDGLKFRRQHPEPPYIIDFVERSLKLAIEIDGATHSTKSELAYDISRTHFLESKGWTVMRLQNQDVYEDLFESCQAIWLKVMELKTVKK